MGFKISGAKMSGAALKTAKSLSFFPLICWWDYRLQVTTTVISGTNRLVTIRDLSANGLNLGPLATTNARMVLDERGYGYVSALFGPGTGLTGERAPSLGTLHNGQAYLWFYVGKINNPDTNSVIIEPLTTQNSNATGHGWRARLLPDSNNRCGLVVRNSSGNLINYLSSNNAYPLDEKEFIKVFTFYGADGLSNNFNAKIMSEDGVVTLNQNQSFSSNIANYSQAVLPPNLFVMRYSSGGGSNVRIFNATQFAVDCTGKSRTEINTMRTEIVAVLRKDPRYTHLPAIY